MPTSSSVRDAHERDGRILTELIDAAYVDRTLTIRAYRPNEWKIRVVDLDTCEFVEARATTFADAAEQVLDDINRGGLE
jgi:hypothetical protein